MSFDLSHSFLVIGVVHLKALPGSAGWGGIAIPRIIEAALADAIAYQQGGCDALFLENFGDMPFTPGCVGPETVAAMAAVAVRVRKEVSLPMGFNVLRNDGSAALGLCAGCGGEFVRVNVHTGAMLTDQGLIQGEAYATVRARNRLCPQVKILADVLVKHALPLTPTDLGMVARDTLIRGRADALILSGPETGRETAVDDLEKARAACPEAVLFVGSGVNQENVARYAKLANGVIIASSLKHDGVVTNPVDVERVRRLVGAAKG